VKFRPENVDNINRGTQALPKAKKTKRERLAESNSTSSSQARSLKFRRKNIMLRVLPRAIGRRTVKWLNGEKTKLSKEIRTAAMISMYRKLAGRFDSNDLELAAKCLWRGLSAKGFETALRIKVGTLLKTSDNRYVARYDEMKATLISFVAKAVMKTPNARRFFSRIKGTFYIVAVETKKDGPFDFVTCVTLAKSESILRSKGAPRDGEIYKLKIDPFRFDLQQIAEWDNK
jgi:hypothetical protein